MQKGMVKKLAALGLAATLLFDPVSAPVFAEKAKTESVDDAGQKSEASKSDESAGQTEEKKVYLSPEVKKTTEGDEKDASEKTDQDDNATSEKAEMPAFEKAKTVDGVKITVKAEEGVFPKDAVLSVENVSKAQEKQANNAVKEERDKKENVAVSYTYDIKVLDKDGKEIEPADHAKVKVAFKMRTLSMEIHRRSGMYRRIMMMMIQMHLLMISQAARKPPPMWSSTPMRLSSRRVTF